MQFVTSLMKILHIGRTLQQNIHANMIRSIKQLHLKSNNIGIHDMRHFVNIWIQYPSSLAHLTVLDFGGNQNLGFIIFFFFFFFIIIFVSFHVN